MNSCKELEIREQNHVKESWMWLGKTNTSNPYEDGIGQHVTCDDGYMNPYR